MQSIKKLARQTGITYLIMVPFGVLGILYIDNNILVSNNIATTIDNIRQNLSMFHLAIFSSLIVQLIQIILVLLLYKLFRPISKIAGALMIAFIIPAVSIAMLNEINYLAISYLITSSSFSAEQLPTMVELFINLHKSGVMIAQIFWGLWLFPMGYLAYKSGFVPRLIGVLLMIGCFGYLADSVFYILNINLGFTVSEYTFLGEILLPLWLLVKAKSIEAKYLKA